MDPVDIILEMKALKLPSGHVVSPVGLSGIPLLCYCAWLEHLKRLRWIGETLCLRLPHNVAAMIRLTEPARAIAVSICDTRYGGPLGQRSHWGLGTVASTGPLVATLPPLRTVQG